METHQLLSLISDDIILWVWHNDLIALESMLHWNMTMFSDPGTSSVQSLSHVCLIATPWTAARQASQSTTNSCSWHKLMSIKLVMPSNNLILCPLLLPPSTFPSIRVFSNESVLPIKWPKYWSFSTSSSNEYSGLISFRNDQFYLLAVQGAHKSFLQHHNLKASMRCSAFLMVKIPHSKLK